MKTHKGERILYRTLHAPRCGVTGFHGYRCLKLRIRGWEGVDCKRCLKYKPEVKEIK